MKKFKRFVFLLLFFVVVSAVLSVLIVRRSSNDVVKGFSFGAPNAQATVSTDGKYTVNYYGYPSTYRIQEAFRPAGDIFNQSTYETIPFNFFYILSNFIFWMALFMALLSPITIFYRPKKRLPRQTPDLASEQIDPKIPSQVKSTGTDIPSEAK